MTVDLQDCLATSWIHILDADEQRRGNQFRFASDRDSYIMAHVLLRRMLSSIADIKPNRWRFISGENGRPEIHPELGVSRLRFSLSHTRGMVACAISTDLEVGVDVEACDNEISPEDIAKKFFADPEVELLNMSPKNQRNSAFYRLWTLKEAYLKATGLGITVPLDAFSFSLDPVSLKIPLIGQFCGGNWSFIEIQPGPNHVLSLAVQC